MDYRPGQDIFETGAECIVNPVNCRVHKLFERHRRAPRGKTAQQGLAGAFEARFPDIQGSLARVCEKGLMSPGKIQLTRVDRKTGKRCKDGDLHIANLATKDNWAEPSRMEWVDKGLESLARAVKERGLRSVALPMLGAGLGRLSWEDVRNSIETHFGPLADQGVSVIVMGAGPERTRTGKETAAPQSASEAPRDDQIYYAGIGARKTPPETLRKMEDIAEELARDGWIMRSGGAAGADTAFEDGVKRGDPSKREIFLPWDGFDPDRSGKKRYADNKTSFVVAKTERMIEIARKYHPRYDGLSRGARAMMDRNSCQMLGRTLDKPSRLVVCWTEGGKAVGGTGQALRQADDMGVPVLNLGDPRLRDLDAPTLAGMARDLVSGKRLEEIMPGKCAERREADER